jgi:hypothetical protein
MHRLIAYFLVFALGTAAAVALASCGGSDSAELLPGKTASQISENLDKVEQLANSGDCVGAQAAAQEVGDQIGELGGVDKTLKQALRKGAARLGEVVIANCSSETEESIAPASIPEPTESTGTETTAKKPPKKPPAVAPNTSPTAPTTPSTPTTPTTPPTTPTTTPTTPPTPPDGTGAPSGGVGPGSTSEGE